MLLELDEELLAVLPLEALTELEEAPLLAFGLPVEDPEEELLLVPELAVAAVDALPLDDECEPDPEELETAVADAVVADALEVEPETLEVDAPDEVELEGYFSVPLKSNSQPESARAARTQPKARIRSSLRHGLRRRLPKGWATR